MVEKILKSNDKFIDKVKKATRLLHDFWGLGGFSYQKTDADGNFHCLNDIPELTHYCIENNLHATSPLLRHPDTFRSGFIFNDRTLHINDDEALLTLAGTTYDIGNTVVLVQKGQKGEVEVMYLIAKPNSNDFQTLVWNHKTLLYTYLRYFKEELKSCLAEAEDNAIHLPTILPHNYFLSEKNPPMLSRAEQLAFLTALGYKELFQKTQRLTSREKKCLQLLLEGKTAKESAAFQHLSPRTVESYLEHIKNKLGCLLKKDLFHYAQLFTEIHLL